VAVVPAAGVAHGDRSGAGAAWRSLAAAGGRLGGGGGQHGVARAAAGRVRHGGADAEAEAAILHRQKDDWSDNGALEQLQDSL
jgi:hypothetical protein